MYFVVSAKRSLGAVLLSCQTAFFCVSCGMTGCSSGLPYQRAEYNHIFLDNKDKPERQVAEVGTFGRQNRRNQEFLERKALQDSDPGRRSAVLYGLKDILARDAMGRLIWTVLRSDSDAEVRFAAAGLAAHVKMACIPVPAYQNVIARDPYWAVRSIGMDVISSLYGAQQLPFYERMLLDGCSHVREKALNLVGEYGNSGSTKAVRLALIRYREDLSEEQIKLALAVLHRLTGRWAQDDLDDQKAVNWWIAHIDANDVSR